MADNYDLFIDFNKIKREIKYAEIDSKIHREISMEEFEKISKLYTKLK